VKVYLYGFEPQAHACINAWLARGSAPAAVRIPPELGSATVAAILDGSAVPGAPLPAEPPVVLFHEAGDDEIQAFIEAYPALACPDPIWAAVTEANLDWSFGELLAALLAERQAIEAGDGAEEPVG
jgi:hypothetical protein